MHGGIELDGRYRIEDRIGRGAMGEVWLSTDLKLNRPVAVKIQIARYADSVRRIDLFRREIEIAAGLQHSGIAVVHDAGEHDGLLYLVMEYIEGEDLARTLTRCPNGIAAERVSDLGAQAASALAFAHVRGVVHRDLKPANVMVTADGRVKICDFGVARVLQDVRGENGTEGVGTPAYMAPEQFGGVVGERSDLYSLGCVLFELITGMPVFKGSPVELMDRHRNSTPPSPAEFGHDVPAELDALVLELLRKRPDDRPSNAEEVRDRLDAVRGGRRAVVIGAGTTRNGVPLRISSPPHPDREPPSSRLLASGTPPKRPTRHNREIAGTVQQVLTDNGVDARVAAVVRGPTVSSYEIRLAPTMDPAGVEALEGRISDALIGIDVRMLGLVPSSSPLPGGVAVGLEISNPDPDVIGLGDVLRAESSDPERFPLAIAVGRTESGSVLVDLAGSPHLLLAGSTRSGKSMAIRAAVTSILVRTGPERARFVLIDSPGGGLPAFDGVPHLITPVVTDPEHGLAALRWVEEEMERRYDDLVLHGHRTVDAYNSAVRDGSSPPPGRRLGEATPHPPIAVFIDELADLAILDGREVERLIGRLTRLARAVGVHLVLATRETGGRFLTERVRAHVPARIAFRTTSPEASELVIDRFGAERLRCAGDALFVSGTADAPIRIRSPLVSEREIEAVVRHWTR